MYLGKLNVLISQAIPLQESSCNGIWKTPVLLGTSDDMTLVDSCLPETESGHLGRAGPRGSSWPILARVEFWKAAGRTGPLFD